MAANLLEPFNSRLSLFKRCVQCPPQAPTCPSCKSDEVCTTTLGDCNSCAVARCVSLSASGSTNANSSSSGKGPNVAAIAGGVVGGIFGVALIVFVIWKFWLNGRRREVDEYQWQEEEDETPEKTNSSTSFMQVRDARSSTHTVASLASTVLTRASNIIQIAYIPGVTNRGTGSPGLLVPPVPPIPIPTTPSTVNSHFDGEQRFFVPELRDSTYSDSSVMTDPRGRKSIASSLARSSIGTTIYRDDAVAHPMPASTTIVRGNAKVVSVRSGASGSINGSPAETPSAEKGEFHRQASGASTSTSKPVIVRMLGSSDKLRPSLVGSQKSGVSSMTGETAKPVPLHILRKAGKGPRSVPGADAATRWDGEGSQSVQQGAAVGPSPRQLNTVHSRPHTNVSVADSVATDMSVPHARARALVGRSHGGDEVEDESSDDEEAHQRSRLSLLVGKEEVTAASKQTRSPFDDDAAVNERGKGKGWRAKKEKSPFEDENAV